MSTPTHSPHAGPGAGAAHAAGHPSAGPRTYVVIAAFLLILTVMEVAVFYIPGLARALVPLLLVMAFAKFALVALFYMHLRFDHVGFSYLFVVPLVIMIGLAVALLFLFGVFGSGGRLGGELGGGG